MVTFVPSDRFWRILPFQKYQEKDQLLHRTNLLHQNQKELLNMIEHLNQVEPKWLKLSNFKISLENSQNISALSQMSSPVNQRQILTKEDGALLTKVLEHQVPPSLPTTEISRLHSQEHSRDDCAEHFDLPKIWKMPHKMQ